MSETAKNRPHGYEKAAFEDEWPGIDSRYRLIVVAALRTKQLLHGSVPRIIADPRRSRNTSIALEEVKQGLVPFTISEDKRGKGQEPSQGESKEKVA